MYICEICGTAFDRPLRLRDREVIDGHVLRGLSLRCPVCVGAFLSPAEPCRTGCLGNGWRRERETLCDACRRDLLERFTDFADELTAEEERQLDDWLDGESVTDRRKWS